jgi:hypothetical protein
MLFLFNLAYAATWGNVAFLIPTEIFPSNLQTQGNGLGIIGWAIGVGMTTLVNPIMFATLEVSFVIVIPFSVSCVFLLTGRFRKNRTYFLFFIPSLIWIPIIYLLYPETSNRSLESIEALFATRSPFSWEIEKPYNIHDDILAERSYEKDGAPTMEHSERLPQNV